MAVYKRAILIAKNKELRATNKQQTRQQNQYHTTIADRDTINISKGQDRIAKG